MEKFKVKHIEKLENLKPFLVKMDIELIRWIRTLAAVNDSTNEMVMHQIVSYARDNEAAAPTLKRGKR